MSVDLKIQAKNDPDQGTSVNLCLLKSTVYVKPDGIWLNVPSRERMYSFSGSRSGGGGGEGVRTHPLKNHKNIGFLSNSCPDPLKNHKATKRAFNFGPSSARQRNAISLVDRCGKVTRLDTL